MEYNAFMDLYDRIEAIKVKFASCHYWYLIMEVIEREVDVIDVEVQGREKANISEKIKVARMELKLLINELYRRVNYIN
jgi:hypothetical protein